MTTPGKHHAKAEQAKSNDMVLIFLKPLSQQEYLKASNRSISKPQRKLAASYHLPCPVHSSSSSSTSWGPLRMQFPHVSHFILKLPYKNPFMSKPQATAKTQAVKLHQLQITAIDLLLPAQPCCSRGGPQQEMTPRMSFLPRMLALDEV